ncbi:hypothetical protein B0A55_03996 [Friedmanniomyces simplex]|uniref:Glycosyltransferase family 34 protein n=1 Tax=Friedmanniomyces simplex TaxID=329884 RepID=A0A4U0XKC4_9PEZI|nr:hypothetical protein B0A55_03996 [Friedmanniomyces simplex]
MVFLGIWATAALGPGEDLIDVSPETYDAASGGVLNDPSGFGKAGNEPKGGYGIIGTDDPDELEADAVDIDAKAKKPSVTGALSELHHAVTDSLQSWNPYNPKPKRPQSEALLANKTSVAKEKKPAIAALSGEVIKEGIKEEDRLGARTRVGKCTIVFNSNSYWERALRTHEEHDRLHGYRLHVLRQGLLDDVWSKPAYILSLLLRELSRPESERLEWLFWVDADTIILNPHVPIETFLPPPGSEFDDIHLIYTNDWNGLNNGIFPIRVNRWSVDLFSAILSYRYYRPDAPLVFRDQSAMGALIQEPQFSKSIVAAPQRWFNAYQGEHNETLSPFQVRRGDLLVHFAGVPDREKRMGFWLERAEQHLDDWEIPVKSTSYPQEARDFWDEQRGRRKAKNEYLSDTRMKATALLTKTDEGLNAYGNRLTDEQKEAISDSYNELKELVVSGKWQDEYQKVEELTTQLRQKAEPLNSVVEQSHKLLLTSAHEAIFAGENDLLQAGFSDGGSDGDLQRISETVKSLKNLVMSSEEFWNNADLSLAVNAVMQARGKWQEKTDGKVAAAEAQAQAERERVKTIEEARKQVQAEANQAAGIESVAPVEVDAVEQDQDVATSVPVVIVTEHAVTVTPENVVVWTMATVTAGSTEATDQAGVEVESPKGLDSVQQ